MSNMELLESAKQAAGSLDTWADFSNFLFNPDTGLIVKAFPSRNDREAFMKTPEYQAIRKLLLDSMEKGALADGANPKSGRFVVRLPKSLHAALEREASNEGVSLNQLVVTKLAVSLSHSTRPL